MSTTTIYPGVQLSAARMRRFLNVTDPHSSRSASYMGILDRVLDFFNGGIKQDFLAEVTEKVDAVISKYPAIISSEELCNISLEISDILNGYLAPPNSVSIQVEKEGAQRWLKIILRSGYKAEQAAAFVITSAEADKLASRLAFSEKREKLKADIHRAMAHFKSEIAAHPERSMSDVLFEVLGKKLVRSRITPGIISEGANAEEQVYANFFDLIDQVSKERTDTAKEQITLMESSARIIATWIAYADLDGKKRGDLLKILASPLTDAELGRDPFATVKQSDDPESQSRTSSNCDRKVFDALV